MCLSGLLWLWQRRSCCFKGTAGGREATHSTVKPERRNRVASPQMKSCTIVQRKAIKVFHFPYCTLHASLLLWQWHQFVFFLRLVQLFSLRLFVCLALCPSKINRSIDSKSVAMQLVMEKMRHEMLMTFSLDLLFETKTLPPKLQETQRQVGILFTQKVLKAVRRYC